MVRSVFVDTSVLDNLLLVPGKCQHAQKARVDFAELQTRNGVQFVLPLTAVIETGNHIAQVKNGADRWKLAKKFGALLRNVAESASPWVLHDFEWGSEFLQKFLDGAKTGTPWPDLAKAKIGAGDLAILVEAQMYRERLKIEAEVWTYDNDLHAYSENILQLRVER